MEISIELDLPEGVTVSSYQRCGEGHGFEVSWPLPERCRCDSCQREDQAHLEYKDKVQVVRDLDIWGQPSFWIYQTVFHRCPWCHHRQHVVPPFKRKDVAYTFRFEKLVLRSLIGSNEEEVAQRLGISAETVGRIVRNQLADAKPIDPKRKITDVGIDELSLKKRHKLFATILSDLSNAEQPEVLAVAKGKDEAAAEQCLNQLSPEQRQQVKTYRADMSAAFHAGCKRLLPKAQPVVDRFHVAKKFGEVVDDWRKKNHGGLQGEADEGGAEGIPGVDVGVSASTGGVDGGGAAEAGGVVCAAAEAAEALCVSAAFPGDLRYGAGSEEGGGLADGPAGGCGGRRPGPDGFLPDLRAMVRGDSELL